MVWWKLDVGVGIRQICDLVNLVISGLGLALGFSGFDDLACFVTWLCLLILQFLGFWFEMVVVLRFNGVWLG